MPGIWRKSKSTFGILIEKQLRVGNEKGPLRWLCAKLKVKRRVVYRKFMENRLRWSFEREQIPG